MFVYYFFATLVLVQGFLSLRGGVRYLGYVRGALREELPVFTPRVTVIVPCRGVEQGLRDNLLSVLAQDYPDYEVIFVVDERGDAAICVIEELMRAEKRVAVRLVVAGRARECGQKVHNLRRAVPAARMASQVFVFVDWTPGRIARGCEIWWRRSAMFASARRRLQMVRAERRNLASMLRAVWNASIASALGPDMRRNFCWGGSTAIRRDVFEQLNVLEQWRGTVSDDFALTRALQHEKLPIRFVPQCLVASHETVSWSQLFEFTTRQIKITRVYAPHLWHIVLWTNLIFAGVFWGGLMLVLVGFAANKTFMWTVASCVAIIFSLGAAKAFYRLRAVNLLFRGRGQTSPSNSLAYLFLWPLTALIYLFNALVALFSRRKMARHHL
ncbi:MAG: glycosyltransferase [Pyrinomonadaceae bacterium]